MRKHSIRITLHPATDISLHDWARRESRPVANAALALIKAGLEAKRELQRAVPSALHTHELRVSTIDERNDEKR